jgi:hypothetical protein
MRVRFELTQRMAELAGFRRRDVDLPLGAGLADALARLRGELLRNGGTALVANGGLHPSVLVVLDGTACPPGANPPLADGSLVQLLLPIAGG